MKVGVVGVGVVGGACKFGFELLGHKVLVHDIALNTKLDETNILIVKTQKTNSSILNFFITPDG